MRTREDRTAINGDQRSPTRPVMVRGWAEAVIDVHRAYSRQIQPSNREPISCEGGVPDSIERTS